MLRKIEIANGRAWSLARDLTPEQLAEYRRRYDAEAREAFERSLALFSRTNPHKSSAAIAHFALAELLERDGDVRGAIARYRQGLALVPTQFQGQIRLARALLRVGDLEGAEQGARRSPRSLSGPQSAELARFFDVLSTSWDARGNADRAQNAARAGLELARAQGQSELAERFEQRIQSLQSVTESRATAGERAR